MTADGDYLAHVPDMLQAMSGARKVTFVNAGLRGFVTFWAAFRVADLIVPHAPNLVMIEFSHNDVTGDALEYTARGLDAIVRHIRAAAPACEFVFVYLAQPGYARSGPTPAMTIYELVADRDGIASIDAATFVEALVERGDATWTEGERALTRDGIHYAPFAREAVGRPFAAALRRVLDASTEAAASVTPAADPFLRDLARYPASTFQREGAWATGAPLNHATRNADAYGNGDDIVITDEPGASIAVSFVGTFALFWFTGYGAIDITLTRDGHPPLPGSAENYDVNNWECIMTMHHPQPVQTRAIVRVRSGTIALGDVFIAGRRSD